MLNKKLLPAAVTAALLAGTSLAQAQDKEPAIVTGDELVGGLYGVRLGGAFFGESMFSRARDASKIALVHLVERMKVGGFQLLDTQFNTAHLSQFGAIDIPKRRYEQLLDEALMIDADFFAIDAD